MKRLIDLCVIVCMGVLLSACASSGGGGSGNGSSSKHHVPSLQGYMPNTAPLPAPDMYQRNSAVMSSTMIAPSRP